jgi:hypothetical protein
MSASAATDPLAQLKDIHAPPDPSWWPPAPGWWILAVIVLVLGVLVGRWSWQRWQRVQARRRLIRAFDHGLAAESLSMAALSDLLRRAARTVDPASASLSGEAWLEALDAPLRTREFLSAVGRPLLDAPFQRVPPPASAEQIALARRWLRAALRSPR